MGTVSYQWSGTNSGSLTDPANWTPAGAPGSGDIAGFGQPGSTADVTATGTDTVGELQVHGDAVTLVGGAVSADGLTDASYHGTVGTAIDDGGSLTLGTTTTTATLNTDTLYVGALSQGSLTVNAGSTLTDTAGYVGYVPGSDPRFSPNAVATVTGNGADWTSQSLSIFGDLTVENGGTVSVAGALDEISGTITLRHGTLRAGTLEIAHNDTLDLDTSSTLAGNIVLGDGRIDVTGSGAFTLANSIALSGPPPVGVANLDAGATQLTLTGAISDYQAPGTLGINGFVRLARANNSYSGGTILDSGANLRVAANGAAGTGPIVMAAPDVTLAVAPHIFLANEVDGFQQGDQIVLAGLTATSASWSNGVLTVLDGNTTVTTLDLGGDYAGASFTVKGNSVGDSVITVGAYQRTLVWNATAMGFESATGWTPAGIPTANDVTEFTGYGGTVTGPGTAGEIVVDAPVTFAPPGTTPVTFTTAGLYDPALNAVAGLSIDGGDLTLSQGVTMDAGVADIGVIDRGGSIDIQGGTLHDTTVNIGYEPYIDPITPDGVANMQYGTWTIDQSLNARQSSFNIVSGTLSVGTAANLDNSTFTMSGGSFSAPQISLTTGSTLRLEEGASVTGAIDLTYGTVTALPGGGGAVTLANDIALGDNGNDEGPNTLSAQSGASLVVDGMIDNGYGGYLPLTVSGDVALDHAGNAYFGGTTLSGSGTDLSVGAQGAAGSGDITFTAGDQALTVATGVPLANTIKGFQSSDTIDLGGVQATSAAWRGGVLTLSNGTTGVATLNLAADPTSPATNYSALPFLTTGDGHGGTDIIVGRPTYTNTDTLTTGTDTITGTAGNDLIIAPPGTLNAGDTIDGGGGFNALELQGGGIFHVNAPTTLQNVQTLYASEGGTSSDQQDVFLRGGTNLAVEVQGSGDNPKAPWLNAITIHGANNSDTIFLGPGYDTVVLGSGSETVVGGSGEVGIVAGSNMLGATLSGGSGGGTLMVTGGGTAVMGDAITRMQTVILSNVTDFTANAESGLTIIGTTTNDTIRAGGTNQTIVGYNGSGNSNAGPHFMSGGFATLIGSTAGHDTFSDSLANFDYDTIENFGAPGDVIDVTDVAPGSLSLSYADQLGLSGNGIEVSITLPGTFDPSGFHLASDNHGGTDITYTAPTATATTASKLTSAMASFSAPGAGALDAGNSSSLDQHTPLLAASTGHA